MGGSVRAPASDCGIVGFKPGLGRIPFDILSTTFDNISHFGPLTRTVADAALFLSVMAGPDPADLQSYVPPLDIADWDRPDLRGLRVAVSEDLGFYTVDAEVLAHLGACGQALAAAGAQVEPVTLPWTSEIAGKMFEFGAVWLAALYGEHLDRHRDLLDPLTIEIIEMGRRVDAVTFKRIERVRTTQWRSLADLFTRYDVLLCPTMTQPAVSLDKTDLDFVGHNPQGRFLGLDLTAVFNAVPQCPAMSVPAGWTMAGLPTGAQIVGRPYEEAMVLRVGAALERQRPWRNHHPHLP